jgi:hypothetical protein
MTMQPHTIAKRAKTSPGKLFWLIFVTLMLAQIAAFWMLCNQQVHMAQARDAAWQVERTAMADCMRYISKATLHSCASRISPAASPAKPVDLALR